MSELNNSDVLPGFVLGLILGLVALMLTDSLSGSYRSLAVAALEECEKTLPRNQQCVITAIPEEMGKND